jgi:hypothetical protein
MKHLAFALILLSSAASAAGDQLATAFKAAFGKNEAAVLKKQGQLKETIKYTPGDIVQAPFATVLLSPGEVVDPTHVNLGKLAIFYLTPSAKGFTVSKRFVPAVQTGAFGKIVDFSVSRSFGDLPVVTVNGAGNWQGYACSTTTLLELAPEGPRYLAVLPMTYDNSAAVGAGGKPTQVNGRIEKIVPGKSFDVVYFGSKDFTEHYVRSGNSYVLANGGQSRVQRC